MTSRDLFELEHGDTGVALLPREASCGARVCSVDYTHGPHVHTEYGIRLNRVNGQSAREDAPHSDRDGSETPRVISPPEGNGEPRGADAIVPDMRVRRLVALSRWERAGMLAYIVATHPEVFDETFAALGLAEP